MPRDLGRWQSAWHTGLASLHCPLLMPPAPQMTLWVPTVGLLPHLPSSRGAVCTRGWAMPTPNTEPLRCVRPCRGGWGIPRCPAAGLLTGESRARGFSSGWGQQRATAFPRLPCRASFLETVSCSTSWPSCQAPSRLRDSRAGSAEDSERCRLCPQNIK